MSTDPVTTEMTTGDTVEDNDNGDEEEFHYYDNDRMNRPLRVLDDEEGKTIMTVTTKRVTAMNSDWFSGIDNSSLDYSMCGMEDGPRR